ncbi:hypothetical protein FOZ63_003163, partial [Perkinsus olseni]
EGSNLNDNLRIYENGTFDFEAADKAEGVSGTACVPICYPSGEQQKTVCALSKHQREAPLSPPSRCGPRVHAFKTVDGLVVLSGTVEAPLEPTLVGTISDAGMRPRETPDGSIRVVHGSGGKVSLDGARFVSADCEADEYPLLASNRQKLSAVVLKRSRIVVLRGKAKADGATTHGGDESGTSTLVGVLPPEVPPPRRLILLPVLSTVCVAVTTAGDVITTKVGIGARFVSLSGVLWPYPYGADNVNTQSVPVPRAAKSAPPPRIPGLCGNFRKLMDDQDLFQCMCSLPPEHREYLLEKVKENLGILVFTNATGHQAKDYARFRRNQERMKRNQALQQQRQQQQWRRMSYRNDHMSSLTAAKRATRRMIKQRLRDMPQSVVAEKSILIQDRVLGMEVWREAKAVGVFLSMPHGEAQTDRLIADAFTGGKRVFVPKTVPDSNDMEL